MAYSPADVPQLERVARETLKLADVAGNREQHDKVSGYRATHLLVAVDQQEERVSLRGTICEVQITSIAAHLFNELEHDIGYKDHGISTSSAEDAALNELLYAVRLADPSAERLVLARAESIQRQTVPLKDAEELKYLLEREAGRPLHGEFHRLYRLLDVAVARLTPAAVLALGSANDLLDMGKAAATALEIEGSEVDDVVHLALALFDQFADEFTDLVREQRGPSTILKKAVLKAAAAR
jgi:hypothetical protein